MWNGSRDGGGRELHVSIDRGREVSIIEENDKGRKGQSMWNGDRKGLASELWDAFSSNVGREGGVRNLAWELCIKSARNGGSIKVN